MPHRSIFSLRFSTKVFLKIGAIVFTLILFMSLFRVNLFFLSVFHAVPNAVAVEVLQAFFVGFRFDLLIWGFLLSPVYLLLLLPIFQERWPRGVFNSIRIFLGFMWMCICALTFVDFFYFAKFGQRMRYNDYTQWNFATFQEQWGLLSNTDAEIFTGVTVLLFLLGLTVISRLKFTNWKNEISPRRGSRVEIGLRLLLPFIVIFLAARGTVEPHHLRYEDSQVSTYKAVNEMALNAVWCFDK